MNKKRLKASDRISIGVIFGRLTIISNPTLKSVNETSCRRRSFVFCRCICGVQKEILVKNLLSSHTKSCGCLSEENISYGPRSDHRLSGTRFYRVYQEMCRRVKDKKAISYKRYGARGIRICKEWAIFNKFRDDMYESYIKHLKEFGEENTFLERIDNDGDYCLSNCTWASWHVQCRNRRSNVIFKGEVAIDASRRLGGSDSLVTSRIYRGWSKQEAFTTAILN